MVGVGMWKKSSDTLYTNAEMVKNLVTSTIIGRELFREEERNVESNEYVIGDVASICIGRGKPPSVNEWQTTRDLESNSNLLE
jgi:hypothetical protein